MSDALPRALADRCASLRAARDAQLPSQILSRLLSTQSAPQNGNPSSLYQVSDLLNPRQLEIVQTDATGLAKAIASKQYTSVEVTEAFIITACCAHQGTNCLAWLFAGEALERARWLDGELERTGQVVGPMHGVPMSVKGEWSVIDTQ
jgi:amidase